MIILAKLKWIALIYTFAFAEFVLQVELPKELQNALWGLAILAITLLGIWAKNSITNLTAKHDLELKTIRDNQEQSRREREWLLETTKTQVTQIEALQRDKDGLSETNRQRDMEIGKLKGTNEQLEKRADERHDAINKAQGEAAEALETARKEKDRADAAEGDLAELRTQFNTLKTELEAANGRIESMAAQLGIKIDGGELKPGVNIVAEPPGENPAPPPGENVR